MGRNWWGRDRGRLGQRLGAAALGFFVAKGLVWLAIAAAGYATLTD